MKSAITILLMFTTLLSFLLIVNSNRADNLQKSRNHFQDSIQNKYRDSLSTLKYENEFIKGNQLSTDLNAENAWALYENMQVICDSIKKSKTKYINVYSTIRNKVPDNAEMIEIRILVTKEEYNYLNRFNE